MTIELNWPGIRIEAVVSSSAFPVRNQGKTITRPGPWGGPNTERGALSMGALSMGGVASAAKEICKDGGIGIRKRGRRDQARL